MNKLIEIFNAPESCAECVEMGLECGMVHKDFDKSRNPKCTFKIIPNKPTNKDIIKAMFPNIEISEHINSILGKIGYDLIIHKDEESYSLGGYIPARFMDAPYDEKMDIMTDLLSETEVEK